MYTNEIIRLGKIMECLLPFESLYEYQDAIRKLLSEGVLLSTLMLELDSQFEDPMYIGSRTLAETKRALEIAIEGFVLDAQYFLHAHKVK